jgi:fatty acid desaturase
MEAWRHADLQRFGAEIDQLRAEIDAERGPDDFKHLRKIERWGRAATIIGYATAWICPNPLSVFAISFGNFVRWAVLAHHILHGGYDRIPEIPLRFTSRGFARGWRRFVDWFDWITPEAWRHEHNHLHHCRLNETPGDPDLVEALVEKARSRPRWVRQLLIVAYSVTWKATYYGPITLRLHRHAEARRRDRGAIPVPCGDPVVPTPLHSSGRSVWLRCWLPYAVWKFGILPALFFPLGLWAWLSVLINVLLAEALTNFHSFLMIVPNHAGEDLYRFEAPVKNGKGEYYLRQIIGSANYRCGGDGNDVLHGWLNYQIEHHVWPDLTLRQYQRAHPRLKALCQKYGIPHVQESVFVRFRKMVAIALQDRIMKRAVLPSTLFWRRFSGKSVQ